MQTVDLYLQLTKGARCLVVDSQNRRIDCLPHVVRGVETRLCIHLFADKNATATMTAEELSYVAWEAFAFQVWEPVTPIFLTNTVSVREDGAIVCDFVNTNTEELAAIVIGRQSIPLWLEINGYLAGNDKAALVIQFQTVVDNRGDSSAGEPSPVDSNYYKKAEADARFGQASGDMKKSVYDTNNDGKVNAADTADVVPWDGITGKPKIPPAPLLLSSPPTSATPATAVGQFAIDTTNHKVYSCEAIANTGTEETPVYEYTWREHVLLDANGKVDRGVLPIAGEYSDGKVGGISVNKSSSGIYSGIFIDNTTGRISLVNAATAWIDQYSGQNFPVAITLARLPYAVRSVLPNVTVIPAASTAYSLLDASATTNNHSWQYTHTPDAATTYTFPAVTNTAVAHRIKLTIDFTTVQTYSFVDANGDAIVPLFTPSITAGDVYEFRCEYSTVQSRWLIYPCKQGAVADDFVMRGEVGAANGVAGLDANAKVPNNQLQIIGSNRLGIALVNGAYGITSSANGLIQTVRASDGEISARTHLYHPIVPNNLNAAVTAALTDAHRIGVDAPLTDAQKANACDSLGAALQPIVQSGAPTTSTVGAVGQLYVDTAGGAAYICTSAESGSYTWAQVTAA